MSRKKTTSDRKLTEWYIQMVICILKQMWCHITILSALKVLDCQNKQKKIKQQLGFEMLQLEFNLVPYRYWSSTAKIFPWSLFWLCTLKSKTSARSWYKVFLFYSIKGPPTLILAIRASMDISRSLTCLLISAFPSLRAVTTSLNLYSRCFSVRSFIKPSMLWKEC